MRQIRPQTCMLKSNGTYPAFRIQIQHSVVIQIACFGNALSIEFDIERIGIVEVLDFHGLNGNPR